MAGYTREEIVPPISVLGRRPWGRTLLVWLVAFGAVSSLVFGTACLGARGEAPYHALPTALDVEHASGGLIPQDIDPASLHCSICHPPLAEETQEAVPHPVDHRQGCLMCHSVLSPWAFPESHELALSESCKLCHTPPGLPPR